jgi:hypothetical protein
MWETLAKYQPYADADGHGETWRVMCEERTEEATWAARAAATAACDAAWAARAAAWAVARAAYWSDIAIERIERAIKERESINVESKLQPLVDLYNELLFAVGKKHPNETRHQTALRYIQQAEVTDEASTEAQSSGGDK